MNFNDPTRLVCNCFGAAPAAGLDLSGFDPDVRVQDDLFRATNGRWLEVTDIPADKPRYGSFMQLSDLADTRLEAAKQFGADVTINPSREDPAERLASLTDGLGVDVAIEAVGMPDTFEMCTRLVRPGGRVANVGVHGKPATLHLEDLWTRNVTITTGLVNTWSTPTLLKLVRTGQLAPQHFVTHRFALPAILEAYDVFSRAADTGALKVLLHR